MCHSVCRSTHEVHFVLFHDACLVLAGLLGTSYVDLDTLPPTQSTPHMSTGAGLCCCSFQHKTSLYQGKQIRWTVCPTAEL